MPRRVDDVDHALHRKRIGIDAAHAEDVAGDFVRTGGRPASFAIVSAAVVVPADQALVEKGRRTSEPGKRRRTQDAGVHRAGRAGGGIDGVAIGSARAAVGGG